MKKKKVSKKKKTTDKIRGRSDIFVTMDEMAFFKEPPVKKKKVAKKKTHKYQVGNIVGVFGGCMARCEILKVILKRKGKGFCYTAKAVHISHSEPSETFFGQNDTFELPERRIVVRLR